MKRPVSKMVVLMSAASMVFVMSFLSALSYAEKGSVETNFEPSKRSMSFIEFTNASENHGVRDMRSLRKRYARYRGGRFPIADAASPDGVHDGDRS
jgi:hypothetical protein